MASRFSPGPARYVNIRRPAPKGRSSPRIITMQPSPSSRAAMSSFADYTCDTEFGHELAVAATRLPAGASAFTPPYLFWQCADANNHAPGLFVDKHGTIFHFNGNRAMPGSIFRTSTDNGVTWSQSRPLNSDSSPANPISRPPTGASCRPATASTTTPAR
jgi:hypothetical protein